MIEVTHLTKSYDETLAVNDLTFTVQPGVVTGFLGPNGSGKSTTMRLILGLDAATAGTATVGGRPLTEHTNPLKSIGFLLDAGAVHPNRSAYDHLRAMAASNGIGKSRVDEVLEVVGLTDVARRRSGGFSLGMGQRLGIASALLGDPEVVMLDEPVNGLDPEGIVWIRHLLQDLAKEGRTVFVSSHLMSEMALMAEHFVIIGRGQLIEDISAVSCLPLVIDKSSLSSAPPRTVTLLALNIASRASRICLCSSGGKGRSSSMDTSAPGLSINKSSGSN